MVQTLAAHRRDWDDLAKVDPLWAILSYADRKHGKWDFDEFLATGLKEADGIVAVMERHRFPIERRAALDFGCGVGRVTRGLRRHFDSAVGVDISATMVEQARKIAPECEFIQNEGQDLPFSDNAFDLVFSKYVLQHQPTKAVIKEYILELFRVLKPGGMLYFQVRTKLPFKAKLQAGRRLYSVLRSVGVPERTLYDRLKINPIRSTTISEEEVAAYLETINARVFHVERYDTGGGAGVVFLVGKWGYAQTSTPG